MAQRANGLCHALKATCYGPHVAFLFGGHMDINDAETFTEIMDVVTRANSIILVATTLEENGSKLQYHMYSSGTVHEGSLIAYATAIHKRRMDTLIDGDPNDVQDDES